jgi:NhaB family Na+:H+ antiporter
MSRGALWRTFLGSAPAWYKQLIVAFLFANPLLLWLLGPVITGWAVLAEFIFVLALTLQCYPLQPGGLIALEAVILGLTSPEAVYAEVVSGYSIILLLIFMVAGVYFLQDMLLVVFSRLLLGVRNRIALAFLFCFAAAALSAFLDALTVIAVILAVMGGLYAVYHRVATGRREEDEHDVADDVRVDPMHASDLEALRAVLRGLVMHAAVGTTLGGVCTLVGEPQNVLIGERAGWDFVEFFVKVAPVSMPVLTAGLALCLLLERMRWFGYGAELPANVRLALSRYAEREARTRDEAKRLRIVVQAVVALLMVAGLAFHVAEVGLIGLAVIVLATAFTGVVEEHRLGDAFRAALPFTALLGTFFVIVALIHTQHLFAPVMHAVLALDGRMQLGMFYLANGALSAISDNVFVATLFIREATEAYSNRVVDPMQFERLVVALNTGTNIPSVATPNGQAAFLFILSSALAPLIRLSYGRMVWMALPYFVVMTGIGLLAVLYLL